MPLTFGIHETCLRFVEVHEIVNNSVHMCDDYFSKHAKNLYVSKLMTHTVIFGVHFFSVYDDAYKKKMAPYFCHHDMKNRNENKRRKNDREFLDLIFE